MKDNEKADLEKTEDNEENEELPQYDEDEDDLPPILRKRVF